MVFVVTALAAYRVWRLVAHDDFPPAMWVRDRFEAATERRVGPDWAGGVRCPWCSGAWVSFAVVAAVWAVRPLPLPAAWFGAVSTIVGLIAQRDDG